MRTQFWIKGAVKANRHLSASGLAEGINHRGNKKTVSTFRKPGSRQVAILSL